MTKSFIVKHKRIAAGTIALFLLTLTLVNTSILQADSSIEKNELKPLPFVAEYFYPRSLIVAFTSQAVGHRNGRIPTSVKDGVMVTHLDCINRIAAEQRIVGMDQIHKNVTNSDWNDDGVYIQNIYRISLASNDNIETAQLSLQSNANIIWAEYETINRTMEYIPNDPMFAQQWHHRVIETPLAWDFVKGTKEIVVAITDTGAKWNHPDLAANIWINEAELPGVTINWDGAEIIGGDGIDNDRNGKIDDVMGWDFFHNRNNPYQNFPGNHHGTHVAGCTGAVGDNGIGVTGVAMSVSLMICKGASSFQQSDGIRDGYLMIQYASQSGADIINCSWGGPGNGNYANSIVNYATALGSLVIAAAGNENTEHTPAYQSFPANATNAMNVAATDQNDTKASFSDFGDVVDISAPGVAILSTYGNNGYQSTGGTSMASPLVAGTAALIKVLHPNIETAALRQRLKDTADYIDDLNPTYAGKLGVGRLNAFTATMYDKTPKISLNDFEIREVDGDNDGVPNPGDTVELSFSLYNQLYWMPATSVTATLTTDMPGVQILTGAVPVPDIHGGSVSFSGANPIRFRTSPLLSEYSLPMTLTVSSNQSGLFPYQVELHFNAELSLSKPGWPLPLTGTSTSPALIADVNLDVMKEIVFGDAQGNLHVMRENKTYLPGFPVNLGSSINAAVAAADLNGNNSIEIVANTQGGLINCVDSQGNILFQYNTQGQMRNNPMLVDVNNNGSYEIVALTFTNPKLFVLNPDGTDYAGFPLTIANGVISSAASADLNGDGFKEIIFVTSAGNLHAISIVTRTDIEGFPIALGATSWAGPSVGDINGDGHPDIAVATVQGSVYGYDRTGNRILFRSVGSPIRTGVIVFDLNMDGSNEIIFGDNSGRLFVLNGGGTDLAPFPINVGTGIESTPVIADMTRNMKYDIIFGDNAGWLHSVNIEGQHTPNFPINLNRALTVSPTIGYVGDVDNVDILIPNQDGYQYVDFKRRIGTIGWSTFQGNMRRTGNSFDMTSVEQNHSQPGFRTGIIANYPNPFNPETTISFEIGDELGNDSPVYATIIVFNIRGQLIDVVADGMFKPGRHSVVWKGTGLDGEEAASGIYFYTLRVPDRNVVRTGKMMLLK